MKRCIEDPELSAYLDQALSADETQSVEAHLRSCVDCRERLEQLGVLREVKIWTRANPKPLPESFYQGVYARIEASKATRRSWWNMPVKVAATVCTLALVVLVTHEVRKPERSEIAKVGSTEKAPEDTTVPINPRPMVLQQTKNDLSSATRSRDSEPMRKAFSGIRAKDVPYFNVAADKKSVNKPVELAPEDDEPQIMDRLAAPQKIEKFEPPGEDLIAKQKERAVPDENLVNRTPAAASYVQTPKSLAAAPPAAPAGSEDSAALTNLGSGVGGGAVAQPKSADGSRFGGARSYVIRNPDQWNALWNSQPSFKDKRAAEPPVVDFDQSIVVVVPNTDPTHWFARILNIEKTASEVVVHYVLTPVDSTAQAAPSFSFQVIPATNLPVSFQQAPQ